MGKLLIESLDKRVRTRKIAKAVYNVLGQVAKIKAELVFQDKEGIHHLNRTTRGVDSVTDVLSYPSLEGIRGKVLRPEDCVTELEGKYIFLGSIVLCEDKIRAQAVEYGNTYEQEREYLIIHGLLHLFGYDHMTEEDKKQMREKEKAVQKYIYSKGKKQ
ncbi:MAG: rRNA maturation RNase YbeY [Clostridia bacterium]|nr:rRNA maturation RNase YbeY [Clostridia bacterium]